MEIYYYKPNYRQDTDIICVVLNKKDSYCIFYDFKNGTATRQKHTPEYLMQKYVRNPNNYKLINAANARIQIVDNDLEMHLPIVQASLTFNQKLL